MPIQHTLATRRCPRRRRRVNALHGFTLIELLVVIAIIALLVSILLPSLNRAKELARTAACKAHIRGAAIAMPIYAAEHKGFLAGPNTSGADLNGTSGNISNDDTASDAPVQNMDWVSPTLADTLGLPTGRVDRLKAVLNTKLKCPSNDHTYDSQYGGSSFPVNNIFYSSYAATLGFHIVGDDHGGNTVRLDPSQNSVGSWMADIPNYTPREDNIGATAEKVYLMEGTRYIDGSGQITFNAFHYQDDGGNFMLYGPATPLGGDPFASDANKPYAYRHVNNTMNLAFFDGHVDQVQQDSPESVDIHRYFPTGFTILSTQSPVQEHFGSLNGKKIR